MKTMNTKALVRLVGINENTLKAWERRYKAVAPTRDEEGHRQYSPKDVERIRLLLALVREGHAIRKLAELSNKALKAMLANSLAPETPRLAPKPARAHGPLDEMLRALKRFDLERLNSLLHKSRFDLSNKGIVMNLVRPLLMEVGKLVHAGEFSVAQEHLLSSLLRDYLGQLHQSLTPYDFSSRAGAKAIALTTREGDNHEFGILMSSILANLYRYRTYYFGPSMPLTDLQAALERIKPDYLVLGMTALPKEKEAVSAADYVAALDARLPRKVTFCLGGGPAMNLGSARSERLVLRFSELEELDQFLADNAP